MEILSLWGEIYPSGRLVLGHHLYFSSAFLCNDRRWLISNSKSCVWWLQGRYHSAEMFRAWYLVKELRKYFCIQWSLWLRGSCTYQCGSVMPGVASIRENIVSIQPEKEVKINAINRTSLRCFLLLIPLLPGLYNSYSLRKTQQEQFWEVFSSRQCYETWIDCKLWA